VCGGVYKILGKRKSSVVLSEGGRACKGGRISSGKKKGQRVGVRRGTHHYISREEGISTGGEIGGSRESGSKDCAIACSVIPGRGCKNSMTAGGAFERKSQGKGGNLVGFANLPG